jgi:hypothetical protein
MNSTAGYSVRIFEDPFLLPALGAAAPSVFPQNPPHQEGSHAHET